MPKSQAIAGSGPVEWSRAQQCGSEGLEAQIGRELAPRLRRHAYAKDNALATRQDLAERLRLASRPRHWVLVAQASKRHLIIHHGEDAGP